MQQTAEGRELAPGAWAATASQLASFSAVRVLAFRGDRKSLRRAIADGRAIAATRGVGDMIRVAHAAAIILHLGSANITRPTRRRPRCAEQDTIGLTAEALPAIVEAGIRSGHAAEAAAALAELERYAAASGTGWAVGLRARSGRSARRSEEAAEHHQKAIDLLSRTTATADLARAHLLYGERLRREQHPSDARPDLDKALNRLPRHGAFDDESEPVCVAVVTVAQRPS